MSAVRIAAFAMSDPNHFGGLLSVVAELVTAGADVRVWTDRRFETQVRGVGASFADILAGRPLDAVDDASRPMPARFVTFAGVHGAAIAAEVGDWNPSLVLYDGFAVIGRVVASAHDLPFVIVHAGHAIDAASLRDNLAREPRVAIDPRCHAAVATLRTQFGFADASPLSYVADPSPFLNIQIEPEPWLTETEKTRLGPSAYFGSVPASAFASPLAQKGSGPLRLYVSFGTIIWRYWTKEALLALDAISQGVSRIAGAEAVLTLGGAAVPEGIIAALTRPGIRVEPFVDQWAMLGWANLFLTHHGIGSTHEAVMRGTPMLSYPFFWDQPALAQRAQDFGLAMPLLPGTLGTEGKLTPDLVVSAISRALERAPHMREAFVSARAWEEQTLRDRPAIARQIIALAR